MLVQDELVASCSYLVLRLARRYATHYDGTSVEDLTSEGYVGLVQAAQKFQPRRGVKFSTFAAPRIRGAMIDLLRRESPLSRPMAVRVAKLKSEQDLLWARLGREPTLGELALTLDLSPAKTGEIMGFRWFRVVSLEAQAGEIGSSVADGQSSPEDAAIRTMIKRELETYLAQLRPGDREILKRIYWWQQKHVEIAGELGISASRVSQRRARALRRLRELIAADGRDAAHYLQAA